jgi:hypothetical protein
MAATTHVSPTLPRETEPTIAHAELDPEWQRLIAAAGSSGRLPFPASLAALSASPDTMRGPSGSIERISPAGFVVDEVRPTFTWPARETGTYTVYIFQDDREVMRSAPLRTATWKPDRDLPRGSTLAWQVEVTGTDSFETIPSPPAPPAMFRIVSEANHADILRARSLHPEDHLLLSVLQARGGLRTEALASLRRAAIDNETAKRILSHEIHSPH